MSYRLTASQAVGAERHAQREQSRLNVMSLSRLIGASAVIGVGIPFVTTTLVYAFAPAADHLSGLLSPLIIFLALSCRLLWPPIVAVVELMRQGVMPNDFLSPLLAEALVNGLIYAALGMLLWYAVFRHRGAWLAFAAVIMLFWSRHLELFL